MSTTPVCGIFELTTGPQNGGVVDLWLASRFGGQPAQGAAPPVGSADYGTVTTGTTYGGPGAWTITGVAEGTYYARVVYSAVSYWSGSFSITDNADVVHITGTETVTGAKTFSGGITATTGVFSSTLTSTSSTMPIVSISGTTSAVAGNHYMVSSGTFTLTMPAPFAGAQIQVTNNGTGTVTIARNTADLFYGPVFRGVTSFKLFGYPGISILLISDGGNWVVSGGASAGPNPYYAIMTTATTTMTNANTQYAVGFTTIVKDPNNNCSTGAAAHYTTPFAGLYQAIGSWQNASGTAGRLSVAWAGATTYNGFEVIIASTQQFTSPLTSCVLICNAGDQIQLLCKNVDVAGTTINSNARMEIYYLGPS